MNILQVIPWCQYIRNSYNTTSGTFFKEQFRYLFSKIDMTVIHINYISIYDWKKNICRLFKLEVISEPNNNEDKIYIVNIPSIPKLQNVSLFLLKNAVKKHKYNQDKTHLAFHFSQEYRKNVILHKDYYSKCKSLLDKLEIS